MESRDAIDQTPLINAVATGQRAVVDSLLRAGADPNHAGRGGVTALMIAAMQGRGEIVQTHSCKEAPIRPPGRIVDTPPITLQGTKGIPRSPR